MGVFTDRLSAADLLALRSSQAPLMVFDCSYDTAQPAWGAAQYRSLHIVGATHADLDRDLSAPHGAPDARGRVIVAARGGRPVEGGRFPLPDSERFAVWLCSVGFRNDMQAVVYDRNGDGVAARLWWMLKWVGHDAAAVLQGGLQAWQAAGGATRGEAEPGHFQSEFVVGKALPPADQGPPPLTEI